MAAFQLSAFNTGEAAMNAKDIIKNIDEFSWMLVRSYVDDFTDAELLVRPVPQANHPAWQFGHMIAGTGQMLAMLGHPAPKLPDGFAEAHGPETDQVGRPEEVRHQGPVLRPCRPNEGRHHGCRGCHTRQRFGPACARSDAGVCPHGGCGADGARGPRDDARGPIRPVRRKLGKPIFSNVECEFEQGFRRSRAGASMPLLLNNPSSASFPPAAGRSTSSWPPKCGTKRSRPWRRPGSRSSSRRGTIPTPAASRAARTPSFARTCSARARSRGSWPGPSISARSRPWRGPCARPSSTYRS